MEKGPVFTLKKKHNSISSNKNSSLLVLLSEQLTIDAKFLNLNWMKNLALTMRQEQSKFGNSS